MTLAPTLTISLCPPATANAATAAAAAAANDDIDDVDNKSAEERARIVLGSAVVKP